METFNFFEKAVAGIEFDEKQTKDNESYGIHRVCTASGCIEFVKLYKNMVYKPHIHDRASAKFIFLSGTGKVIIGDEEILYSEGLICSVPAGVMHGFIQHEETIFLSVQSNPIQDRSSGEIDIRYE